MSEKTISKAVIKRLPRYYRYLGELRLQGVKRISSGELSDQMQVTASQIRQDLNNFGGFGQQGYGYNVSFLFDEIGKILGVDTRKNIIVMGAGNMGQALTKYTNFRSYGFDIIGIFDVDPNLVGRQVNGIYIQELRDVKMFVESHHVDIAVLAVPKEAANTTAEHLVELGIKAFWNFAHVDLNVPDDIVVENVHLSDSLMKLTYNITRKEQENDI